MQILGLPAHKNHQKLVSGPIGEERCNILLVPAVVLMQVVGRLLRIIRDHLEVEMVQLIYRPIIELELVRQLG